MDQFRIGGKVAEEQRDRPVTNSGITPHTSTQTIGGDRVVGREGRQTSRFPKGKSNNEARMVASKSLPRDLSNTIKLVPKNVVDKCGINTTPSAMSGYLWSSHAYGKFSKLGCNCFGLPLGTCRSQVRLALTSPDWCWVRAGLRRGENLPIKVAHY